MQTVVFNRFETPGRPLVVIPTNIVSIEPGDPQNPMMGVSLTLVGNQVPINVTGPVEELQAMVNAALIAPPAPQPILHAAKITIPSFALPSIVIPSIPITLTETA
jgi:hypothetical protein